MRVDSLTFFRFIAALIVVFFHFGSGAEFLEIAPGFLTAGPQMVTFFYVLSGYVLVLAYKDRTFSTVDYYVKRVARLAPAYFVALGLYLSLLPSLQDVPAKALILNFTLLQSWFPSYPMLINSPGWSLSVEMFFYAIFPFLMSHLLSKQVPARVQLAGSLGLWVLTQVILCTTLNSSLYGGYGSICHDLINYFPLSHLCSFLIGMSGATLFLSYKTRLSGNRFSGLMFPVFSVITFFALENERIFAEWIGMSLPTGSSFWAPLFLALILSVSSCQNIFTHLLSSRPCVILGEASYSLYILQMPMYILYRIHISKDPTIFLEHDLYSFVIFLIISSLVSFYTVEMLGKRLIMGAVGLGRGLMGKDTYLSAAVEPSPDKCNHG